MIPAGAFDRVDGSAGDSDQGSTIRICFPRLPDPVWAPIGRNNLVAVLSHNYRSISVLDARYPNVTPDPI